MGETQQVLFYGAGWFVVGACAVALVATLVTGALALRPATVRGSVIASGFAMSAAVGALLIAGVVYFDWTRGSYKAVAHASPEDRETILAASEREAKVPLAAGTLVGLPCLLAGAVALVTGARRLTQREEGA